jgi:DNA-binding response OmpR family regulator
MRAIREGGGRNSNVPILAFSAGVDASSAAARLQAGFDGDLPKPMMPADLIAAIAFHIARRGAGGVGKHRAA